MGTGCEGQNSGDGVGMGKEFVGLGWGWGKNLWGRGGDGDMNNGDGWGWGPILVPMQLSSSHHLGGKHAPPLKHGRQKRKDIRKTYRRKCLPTVVEGGVKKPLSETAIVSVCNRLCGELLEGRR